MIISASRRTDLPAWGMDEFMADLRRGWRLVPNPYNAARPRLVSLAPGDVDCLVFWTRNPLPVLAHAEELEGMGLPYYVQLTITGYPGSIEPAVLGTEMAIDAAARLSARIGRDLVVWRYDPIVLAGSAEASSPLDPGWHLENFARLAGRLEGRVRRVTLSMLDEYRHTRARLARAGYPEVLVAGEPEQAEAPALPPDPWPGLLAGLADEAARRGMEAVACAEPWDLRGLGIGKAACVDRSLAALAAERLGRAAASTEAARGEPSSRERGSERGRDRGQRPACGCAPSVDIGTYGSCRSGCVYCYARR